MSNVELSGTDDEEEKEEANNENEQSSESEDEIFRRRLQSSNRANIFSDDSEDESDNEEVVKRRETMYREHPDGDEDIIEDEVYSKATRKSIHGFLPVKQEAVDPDGNESDDQIIISDTDEDDADDDEDDVEEEEQANHKKMSSTMISSDTDTSASLINKSDVKVTESSTSSTSVNEELDSMTINDGSDLNGNKKKLVSESVYNQALKERQALEEKLVSISKARSLQNNLPDAGKKLNEITAKLVAELDEKIREIKMMVIDEQESVQNRIKRSFNEDPSFQKSMGESSIEDATASKSSNFLVADDVQPKYTGKVGMKNFQEQKALTEEKLQDIHESLNQRPADDVESSQPKHLKVTLMKHQLQALAFMEWREHSQKPRGGLLADDMGLGKTLTAISLVMKQLQKYETRGDEEESDSEDEERDNWIAQGRRDLRAGNTLVVCPATLMKQWEYEIKTKVKRGALDVLVFHGASRPTKSRDVAKYDVVITTYQIIVSEHKSNGCIFGLRWDRVILDEGHVIRNCKSKQAEAVFALEAKHRWVMTGTPVQNKEFDIFSTIKFLRCSPFDDLRYWKTWIEVRGGGNSPRLQALLKSILLRRTKAQLIDSGEVESLPSKSFEQVNVELNHSERLVYNKVMAFSQAILAEYIQQSQEKHNNYTYDKAQLGKYYSKVQKMFNHDRKIESHEILTLLLRLRQVCCHPGLMKEMLENTDLANSSLNGSMANVDDSDPDIVSHLQRMKITNSTDQMMTQQAISLDDDVFNFDVPSSKLEKLIDVLNEKIVSTSDKAIIVSQWVSYLNIVKGMLEMNGITYCELNGKVPVKDRNDLVVSFNKESSKTKVMLLSITAGGVGLNLVGANMLFILDPHW